MDGQVGMSTTTRLLNSQSALGPLAPSSGGTGEAIDPSSSKDTLHKIEVVHAENDSAAGTDSGYEEGSSALGRQDCRAVSGQPLVPAMSYPPLATQLDEDRRQMVAVEPMSHPQLLPHVHPPENNPSSSPSSLCVDHLHPLSVLQDPQINIPQNKAEETGFTVTSGKRSLHIFGTPPTGTLGRHRPREYIRIDRDYSAGELCQFNSGYPVELEGRVRV